LAHGTGTARYAGSCGHFAGHYTASRGDAWTSMLSLPYRLKPSLRFNVGAPCVVWEREFTRTLESFAPTTPILVAEFDSSLSGAGLIWSVRTNGTEVVRGVSAVNLDFLGFRTDSSNHNLAE
jgi:hypothetical protein